MKGFKRRRLPGLAGGAFAKKTVLARARPRTRVDQEAVAHPVGTPRDAAGRADGAEPLPESTLAWIGRLRNRGQTHLFYPVSRLQREFRLGYGQACALADLLAQRGEWTIRYSTDGTRYARIQSRRPV